MNTTHTPRLWKAALSVSVGVLIMSLSSAISDERTFWIVFSSGILAAVFGIIEAFMANWGYVQGINIEISQERRYYIECLKGASADVRGMVARLFPDIDIEVVGGDTIYYWRGTSVPVQILQEFLRESNSECTVSQRSWKMRGIDDTPIGKIDYWWAWMAIYKRLTELDYVIENSHNGPRSELWRGNAYNIMCHDWLQKPLRLPELVD